MRHRSHGFTLVEVLIYTVLAGMMMTSMVLLANASLTIRSKLRASTILSENVRFAIGRITSLVSEASGITSPTLGSTSGTLVLTMASSTINPITITSADGVLYVAYSTDTYQAITSPEVAVSELTITRLNSTSPFVRIVLTAGLRDASTAYSTITVTTTAAVRR